MDWREQKARVVILGFQKQEGKRENVFIVDFKNKTDAMYQILHLKVACYIHF